MAVHRSPATGRAEALLRLGQRCRGARRERDLLGPDGYERSLLGRRNA